MTNAFNLLDNMDGLCAGLWLIAGAGVLVVAAVGGVAGAEAIHPACCSAPRPGSWSTTSTPASIFMGDSGSLFIGCNLAVLTLSSPTQTHAPANLLSVMAGPALILLVPILDTTLVTVSRLLSGRSAAQGGRDHSSHRLVAIGLSERAAVLVLWALPALGGLLGSRSSTSAATGPSIGAALFVIGDDHLRRLPGARARVRGRRCRASPAGGSRRSSSTSSIGAASRKCCWTSAWLRSRTTARTGCGSTAGSSREYFPRFLESLPLVLGVQFLSLFTAGGYRGVWRYFGLMDGVDVREGRGARHLRQRQPDASLSTASSPTRAVCS